MELMSLPILNSVGGSARELIVSLLSREWPLSIKEIYNRLRREHGFSASYQAVHKAVLQAAENGVLEKQGTKYMLNKEWIEGVKKFGAEVDSCYRENGTRIDPEKFEGSAHLRFGSFLEFAKFMINEYFGNFPNPARKAGACIWNHAYAIVGASEKEHENIKKIFSREPHYGISRCDTFFDRWCSDYLTKAGKKCVTGTATCCCGNDTFVHGDFVMEVFFPSEFREALEKIYSKFSSPQKIDMNEYFETILSSKFEINVLITKNPSLAEKFRREAKEAYEKGNKK